MKTNLCHMLGIENPIIAAPMGPDLTGPGLVAAVSNAGGLGILQAQTVPSATLSSGNPPGPGANGQAFWRQPKSIRNLDLGIGAPLNFRPSEH